MAKIDRKLDDELLYNIGYTGELIKIAYIFLLIVHVRQKSLSKNCLIAA